MSKKNRIRLYLNEPFTLGGELVCNEAQSHYLCNVMRLVPGSEVYIFNGQDGEFKALTLNNCGKKCRLKIVELYRQFTSCPDLQLIFAPLKKDNTDFVVAKAVELGVTQLQPVITDYTSVDKVRTERIERQIIEAAEQCRRLDIPRLNPALTLQKLLSAWQPSRCLYYLDESGNGKPIQQVFSKNQDSASILVGPEGGFSEKELDILRKLPYTVGITLGKRILRAETAALAALSCWQAWCGDWQE